MERKKETRAEQEMTRRVVLCLCCTRVPLSVRRRCHACFWFALLADLVFSDCFVVMAGVVIAAGGAAAAG